MAAITMNMLEPDNPHEQLVRLVFALLMLLVGIVYGISGQDYQLSAVLGIFAVMHLYWLVGTYRTTAVESVENEIDNEF